MAFIITLNSSFMPCPKHNSEDLDVKKITKQGINEPFSSRGKHCNCMKWFAPGEKELCSCNF